MQRTFGNKKVTANELAKLAIIERLRWTAFDEDPELENDPETLAAIEKHIQRVYNALDGNGNLRNKIWG